MMIPNGRRYSKNSDRRVAKKLLTNVSYYDISIIVITEY